MMMMGRVSHVKQRHGGVGDILDEHADEEDPDIDLPTALPVTDGNEDEYSALDEDAQQEQDEDKGAGDRDEAPGRTRTHRGKRQRVSSVVRKRPSSSVSGGSRGDTEAPPRTGAEYLLMVRREAASCPQVVVAKSRDQFLASSSSSSMMAQNPAPPRPPRRHSLLECLSHTSSSTAAFPTKLLLPSPEWTNSFLLTFASLRLELERISGKKRPPQPTRPPKIPKLENEAEWRKVCLGTNGSHPTTSLLCLLNQRQTLTLIEHHTRWLGSDSISPLQSQWIFSLLLKVDKLLTGDATDTLRSLCRRCLQVRASLCNGEMEAQPDEQLASLNIIIVIVARYFQQRDLCDDSV